jgi:hypothetical protein
MVSSKFPEPIVPGVNVYEPNPVLSAAEATVTAVEASSDTLVL